MWRKFHYCISVKLKCILFVGVCTVLTAAVKVILTRLISQEVHQSSNTEESKVRFLIHRMGS